MQYSLRTLLEIIAAAGFVLALVIAWRAKPPAPAPAPPVGRYQVFVTEDDVVVMDTATGWLWTRPKSHSHFSRSDSPWREEK
jgi:hypothetical protein